MVEWVVEESDECDPMRWTGQASTAWEAAESAVEHWYDLGAWSGEVMPSRVEVKVKRRGEPSEERRTVVIDWSPTFTALSPEVVPAERAASAGKE